MILAVAAIAILIVAGISLAVLNNDAKGTKDQTITETNRLVVFGNANNDDYIDGDDVSLIEDIAEGRTTWNSTKNPFADVNVDGGVDSTDVMLVKKIVSKEKTIVYYLDFQDEAVVVDYPITGTIGTMYYQQAQLAILLDLWEDDVIACGVKSLNDVTCPGYADKISYGDGFNVDPELVMESGVDTIICYTQTDTTAPAIKQLVKSTGDDLNVLCINHESLLTCVVTYGFLFDKTDISLKYAEYADKCNEEIYNSLKDVAKKDQPSVAIVMLYGTATTDKIRVLGYNPSGNSNNLGVLINSIPNVNWVRADSELPAYGTYVTSEWFLQNDPDYIIVASSGIGTTVEMTDAEVYNVLHAKCEEVFGETNAFKNGHIVVTTNGLMNGYSMPLVSLKLLSFVYDEIDQSYADEVYDKWYSDYSLYTIDNYRLERMFYVNPQ